MVRLVWLKNVILTDKNLYLSKKYLAIFNRLLYNSQEIKIKKEIVSLMKRLAVKKNVECMACLECVRACSNAFYKEFNEDLSCIKIVAKGAGAKPMTCIQCGKCAKVCEAGAITQNPKTGIYMINKKLCTSCGKCAEACPMKVMVAPAGGTTTKCIACGICVKACPMELLEILEK